MPSSAILMRAILIFIFLMLCGQIAGAQTGLLTDQTIFTIEINESGNAFWIVEKHKPFATQSEINEWEFFMKDPANFSQKKDITEFRNSLNKTLQSAANYSNRSMSIENFNVSYDVFKSMPNAYRIIRYSFEWKNFSLTNSSQILIGDAFSEGMVPSSDNVLVIKMPEGYTYQNVTPRFDKSVGNRLIWDGSYYQSFGKGEPSIVLSRNETSVVESPPSVNVLFIAFMLISGTIFVFWIKRRHPANSRKNNTDMIDKTGTQPSGSWVEKMQTEKPDQSSGHMGSAEIKPIYQTFDDSTAVKDSAVRETIVAPFPDLTREILDDEEMIEKYLIKFGGQAYQSEIVKESGLSKSKISIVLAKMKEDGRILKIRKGKENIIRMVPKK